MVAVLYPDRYTCVGWKISLRDSTDLFRLEGLWYGGRGQWLVPWFHIGDGVIYDSHLKPSV
jgi:hypothetical protein